MITRVTMTAAAAAVTLALAACSSSKAAVPPQYSALIASEALATDTCAHMLADGAPAPSVEQTKAGVPCKLADGSVQINVTATLDDPCEVVWIDTHYWRPGVGVVHTGDVTRVGGMADACAQP